MEYSVPEILRVPLEELCLHIMVWFLVLELLTLCGGLLTMTAFWVAPKFLYYPPPQVDGRENITKGSDRAYITKGSES